MCEHAHVRNLPALIVYVDRQGEQPPARGMWTTPRAVMFQRTGDEAFPLSSPVELIPVPVLCFKTNGRSANVPITLRAKSSTKYPAFKPVTFVNPPGRLTSSISTTI